MNIEKAITIARAAATTAELFGAHQDKCRRFLNVAEGLIEHGGAADDIAVECRATVGMAADSICAAHQLADGLTVDEMNGPEAGAVRKAARLAARAAFDAEMACA